MLKKAIILLVVLFFSLWGLEKLYGYFILQNKNVKSSYISTEKINADILIHGPCIPMWMVKPEILDEQTQLISYNLSLSQSGYADSYLHFYLYLKNNKPPKYLFLYVTPESMDEKSALFGTYRFAPFLDDSIVANAVQENDPEYFKWTRIPFIKYGYYNNNINFNFIEGAKHFLTDRQTPYYRGGFEPPFKVDWDYQLEELIKLHPQGTNFAWSSKEEKYLKKIIELAAQHHIIVYLYESPVLNEAKKYQLNRNEIINKIQKIAEQYTIQYLLFDTMSVANSRAYYFSPLSTNPKGSEIFSNEFGKYMKREIIDKTTN